MYVYFPMTSMFFSLIRVELDYFFFEIFSDFKWDY